MPDTSPNLALPYLQPAQAQKHVTHNEALQRLDILVQLTVEGFDQLTPPALPDDGAVYALGTGTLDAWAGQDGKLAAWADGAWLFVTPLDGWRAWGRQEGEFRVWSGSAWRLPPAPLDDLDHLGINTTADATNRLAVAAPASLFTHAGSDHRMVLDKAAAGDTATLLFQNGFSGRAEIGLAGDDDFSFKVSPDGTSWASALVLDGTTGAARALSGFRIDNQPAYHRGNILAPVSQSGGTPTGGVIEHGSTADGDYVRFADGTQICTVSGLTTSTSADTTWTYPAAFAYPAHPHRPVVTGMAASTAGAPALLVIGGVDDGSDIKINTVDLSGARVSKTVHLLAVGRWF